MTNNTTTSISFFGKLKKFFFKTTFGLICIGVMLGFTCPEQVIHPFLPERIVVREVPEREQTFEDLVKEIPETYGIPSEIVQTVLVKESGGRAGAKRFEPGHLERFGKKISSDPETAREYSSSHCQFQVMAWHLKFGANGQREDRGNWYDLYNPEVCVREFARIWIECEKRWKDAPNKVAKYQKAFECYNGSERYADDAMNRLARLAIEKL